MHGNRVPRLIGFAVFLAAVVFGVLGIAAISERAITTGGRAGIHHAEDTSAVILGFFFVGVALAALGSLAYYNPFRNLIWLLLALLWLASFAAYGVLAG